MTYLLYLNLFLSVVVILMLIYLGAFLVSFRDSISSYFKEINDETAAILPVPGDDNLTWDQKYERDLETLQKLSRQQQEL